MILVIFPDKRDKESLEGTKHCGKYYDKENIAWVDQKIIKSKYYDKKNNIWIDKK